MATRRRRNTATNAEPTLDKIPDGAWDDFGAEAPELTHEEMVEIAEEREAEAQMEETPEEEEQAIEAIMSMALADTFEALQKAEEEKGVDDFFDPSFYSAPKPVIPQERPAKRPRYIPRSNARRRKG